MLDGLLGRGFSFKCKSVIKANRARMEVVRRRAEAKQRFLKEDLAKLLSNGLDINAYGRTEEFLAGMNLLSSYDFIEQSCEFIVKQLSRMQKQGECPEECREAVASLMFAAARFSDLPELRDLRDTFQERYGNCLEVFVSQKFVEKLSSKPPAAEKKLQVLQDIASEFSINWDFRGFEQRMAAPSVVAKVHIPKTDIGKQKPALLDEKKRGKSYGGGNVFGRDEFDHHIAQRQGPSENRETPNLKRGESISHIQKPDVGKQKPALLDEKNRENGYGGGNSLKIDHITGRQGPTEYREKSLLNRGENSLQGDDGIPFHGRHRQTGNKHSYLAEQEPTEYREKPQLNRGDNSLQGDGGISFHGRHRQTGNKHSYPTEQEPTEYREKPQLNRGENSLQGDGSISFHGRHRKTGNKHSYLTEQGVVESRSERSSGNSSHGKMLDNAHVRYTEQSNGISNSGKTQRTEPLSREKVEIAPNRGDHMRKAEKAISALDYSNQNITVNSIRQKPGEETDKLKPCSNYALPPPYVKSKDKIVPPPYTKPKEEKHRASRGSKHVGSDVEGHSVDPSSCKTNVVNGSDRFANEPHHYPNHEEQGVAPAKAKTSDHENELDFQGEKFPLPKPRSIRRKHHRSSTSYDVEGSFEDGGVVKRSSSSRRKDSSRKGTHILFDEEEHHKKDDEERLIDNLLIHYSKKPTSYDAEKIRKKLPPQPSHRIGSDAGESSTDRSRNAHHEKYEVVPPPTRSVSLPREQITSQEVKKVFTRVNTFQPDNQAKHVHPKLPDYDDLAARFAALKGR